MIRLLACFSIAVLVAIVSQAQAASISGIVVYAADDFGTPNGRATYDGELQAELWRTGLGGIWHGLAVYAGPPPGSLRAAPLNAPNFMVEIPLSHGENVFTLLGDPGPMSDDEGQYERFVVNLYLDGNIDAAPSASALFNKLAPPQGGPVSINRSDYIYTLGLQQTDGRPQTFYDDGLDRVTITAASFLPQRRFDPELNIDYLSPQSFRPSGNKDFIGVLKVMVEPSPGEMDTTAPKAIVPAFGAGAGSGGGAAGGYAPGGYGNPGYGDPGYGGIPSRPNQPQGDGYGQRRAQLQPTEIAPTPVADVEEDPTPAVTPEQTGTAGSTPAPDTRTPATTGTPGAATTPTPGAATTASPASTASAATTALAGTPTAAQTAAASGSRTPAKTASPAAR